MRRSARCRVLTLCCAAAAYLGPTARLVHAQDASTAPASVPAGALPADHSSPKAASKPVSEKQSREADNAYLAGAKAMQRGDLAAAERDFGRAVQLDPSHEEYLQSLTVAREHRVQELVGQAATARQHGNSTLADSLLAQARALAPDSRVVTQHFDPATPLADFQPEPRIVQPAELSALHSGYAGPIFLKPTAGLHSFHQTATVEEQLRNIYAAYGIKTQFPTPVGAGRTLRFELDDADFATATRVIGEIANSITVPVQPDLALIVPNTQESRDQYQPLMEETLYMPGISGEAMTELSNVARQVFDLKQVNGSQTQGNMLLRGDAKSLQLLNAVYADLLAGAADVQLDVALYEVDKTHTRNVGIQTPSSVGAFSIYGELQSLLSQYSSVISAAVASGALTLTGNPAVDIPKEIAILYAAGDLTSVSQLTNLLGTVGSFGGIPLAGVYLGSGATLNFALNSTDTRILDFAQLRASDRQAATFKAGTRYPVITGTYSSGITSSTLSGLTASQQQLVNQYLGSSTSVSIPQFQYEDLGLTLKATPIVHADGSVSLTLDMKVEALGGTSINDVPVLNSRALTSTVTVPTGQTVLLASEITRSEMRSISGLPGLSDLPGFQGTNRDTEKDTSELLITLTPHIVRVGHHETASRRFAINRENGVQ